MAVSVGYRRLAEQAAKEGIQRFVVGGVIANRSTILLLRRKKDDFMPGIYELASGKVEKNETLGDALCREVTEETGLKVNEIGHYLGHFDYQSKSGAKTRQFNFAVNVKSTNNVKLTEHDGYAWVTLKQLKDYNVTDNVKVIIESFFKLYSSN